MIKGIRFDNDQEVELPFVSSVGCSISEHGSVITRITISDKQALTQFIIDNPDLNIILVTDETSEVTGYFWPKRSLQLMQGEEFDGKSE